MIPYQNPNSPALSSAKDRYAKEAMYNDYTQPPLLTIK